MFSSLSSLLNDSSATIFGVSALVGTTFFLLRVLMALVGGLFDADVDDADGSDFEPGDSEHHTLPSFKLFTLHSLSGFFMMFGFVGLACIHQLNISPTTSFMWAFLIGFAVMVLTACIFQGFLRLQGQGAVFSIEKTVGITGMVYQTIPERGQGKIHVVVNGVTRELLAQSRDQECIDSFTTVRVVRVIDHEIVEVVQI